MERKDCLTVEIAGGLGNQLFMFYAGLFFQENFQREVTFDITDLARIQELHPGANIQSLGLLDDYRTTIGLKTSISKLEPIVTRIRRLSTKLSRAGVFTSENIGYINPNLIPPDVKRIRGYFQSWIYFNSLGKKPLLGLKNLSSPSRWLMEEIDKTKSRKVLSLHVRRGDYALPINRMNGILSTDYYKQALAEVDNYDSIWIFTDSPKEVESEFSQLGFPFEVVYPPSNTDPVESLLLMAATKNIVISNSTFSWWAAMIAGDSASIHAPSKWFELSEDPNNLIPDNWNRIPSEWVKQ